jgi:hypothetical protein
MSQLEHTQLINALLSGISREGLGVAWRQHVGLVMFSTGARAMVGITGMSDIGGVLYGGTAFQIEVKTGGARRNQMQRAWDARMTALGAFSFLAHAQRKDEHAAVVRHTLGLLRELSDRTRLGHGHPAGVDGGAPPGLAQPPGGVALEPRGGEPQPAPRSDGDVPVGAPADPPARDSGLG